MNKAIFVLLFFLFLKSSASASQIDTKMLDSLPEGGRHSCYFVNKRAAQTQNLTLCSATIISQTQVVLEDSSCWQHDQKRSSRVAPNETQLVCNGAKINYKFTPRPSHQKVEKLIIAQLPEPLPYEAPNLNTDKDKRLDLLASSQCRVRSATLQGTLKNDFLLDEQMTLRHNKTGVSPHLAGGHIVCNDPEARNNETIIAIIGEQGNLYFVDEQTALLSLVDYKDYKTPELALEQRVQLLCQETEVCLDSVSPASVDLTSNTLDILKVLSSDLNKDISATQDQALREQALDQLTNILREILIACQNTIWNERRSSDSQAQEGYLTGLSGTFERLTISVAQVVSDDFLLNQFRNVDLFTENLTPDQMKTVLAGIEPQIRGLNNIQRVAQSAKALAFEVVGQFLRELNPDMSAEQIKTWLEQNGSDFVTCLNNAKSSAMVKECGDKFGETVPALIAKTQLERQIEQNFLSLYTDSQNSVRTEDYLVLKNESTLAFQRCIQNYYSKNERPEAPERAKACVYEGLLAGYHHTAREQIRENLKGLIPDRRELEDKVRDALEIAQNCDYGPLFHRSGRMSQNDYQLLSNLEVKEFQDGLEQCSQSLTQNVGSLVVIQTILNTPEVKQNFDEISALTLSQQVVNEIYTPCIERQKEQNQKIDPRRCELMITELTTLKVASALMEKALDEQLESLGSTALTIDQQNLQKLTIQDLIEDKIIECHDRLKNELLDDLGTSQNNKEQVQRKTLLCVNEGVKIMASKLTLLKLEATFTNDPNLRAYGNQILKRDDIQTLPIKTAQCFSQELQKLESVNQLSTSLDKISSDCALQTEKTATIMALEVILEERLKENIPNSSERSKFIADVISKENGLANLILKSATSEELQQTVTNIPALVTLDFAKESIPKLVDQHLKDKISQDKIQQLSQTLIDSLSSCISLHQPPTDEQLSICINKTSALGHKEILEEMVLFTARENLPTQEPIVQKLAQDSQERIKLCLESVDTSKESSQYNEELEKCMVTEIGFISRDIPREVILSMSPLLSSRSTSDQLRAEFLKVEEFYSQKAQLSELETDHPAIGIYMRLNSCISGQRSLLKAQDSTLTEAQKSYETCTSKIEQQIKDTIRQNFVNHAYPGKTPEHKDVLNTVAEILTELPGEPSPAEGQEKSGEQTDSTKTLALMDVVGQSTIVACNYDRTECEQSLSRTKEAVSQYKQQNPRATSKELEQLFINSPFIELVIESSVSQAMASQLTENLKEFFDEEGILARKIQEITSPTVLGPIMKNRYGLAAKALIRQSILEGQSTNDVVNNPALKASLGMALTQNLEIDSFSDQLLHGLVQPILNQQQRSSNNPAGLLTNPKVTIGRLFGVVKGSDFSWERIRTTPQGLEARRIFAKEILQPALEGQEAPRMPAQNMTKSLRDDAMERIQNLVSEGIKELNR